MGYIFRGWGDNPWHVLSISGIPRDSPGSQTKRKLQTLMLCYSSFTKVLGVQSVVQESPGIPHGARQSGYYKPYAMLCYAMLCYVIVHLPRSLKTYNFWKTTRKATTQTKGEGIRTRPPLLLSPPLCLELCEQTPEESTHQTFTEGQYSHKRVQSLQHPVCESNRKGQHIPGHLTVPKPKVFCI